MNNWVKTIFRHDTQQGGVWYSCAVAGKDQEGEKSYEYWPVDFPQDTQIPDRARVEFKDFFISYYTRKDGTIQHKFVVSDFLMAQPQQPPAYQQAPQGYQRQAIAAGPGGYVQQYQAPPQYVQYGQPVQPGEIQTNTQMPQPNVRTTAQLQQAQQAAQAATAVNRRPQPDFEQLEEDVPF